MATTTTGSDNALSVLLSALPSSARTSIEASIDSSDLAASSTSISQPTSSSSIAQTSSATSTEPATRLTSPSSTFRTSAFTSSAPSSSPAPITSAPTTSAPTASTSITSQATDTDPGSSHASIAGIATGVAAGVILILLIFLYIFRRRQQHKPLMPWHKKIDKGKDPGVYPESAWLYDPPVSPPRDGHHDPSRESLMSGAQPGPSTSSHPSSSRDGLGISSSRTRSPSSPVYIPEPRAGAIEMAETSVPSLRPNPSGAHGANSPLLTPTTYGSQSRDQSPMRNSNESPSRERLLHGAAAHGVGGGSHSPSGGRKQSRTSFGQQSRPDPGRPLTAIWEEGQLPGLRTEGLLFPPERNPQRHST